MADKVVAPPELAGLYGERLVYLPYSYHIADQSAAFPRTGLEEERMDVCVFNHTSPLGSH